MTPITRALYIYVIINNYLLVVIAYYRLFATTYQAKKNF